jgi:hypothetical protein
MRPPIWVVRLLSEVEMPASFLRREAMLSQMSPTSAGTRMATRMICQV